MHKANKKDNDNVFVAGAKGWVWVFNKLKRKKGDQSAQQVTTPIASKE